MWPSGSIKLVFSYTDQVNALNFLFAARSVRLFIILVSLGKKVGKPLEDMGRLEVTVITLMDVSALDKKPGVFNGKNC